MDFNVPEPFPNIFVISIWSIDFKLRVQVLVAGDKVILIFLCGHLGFQSHKRHQVFPGILAKLLKSNQAVKCSN